MEIGESKQTSMYNLSAYDQVRRSFYLDDPTLDHRCLWWHLLRTTRPALRDTAASHGMVKTECLTLHHHRPRSRLPHCLLAAPGPETPQPVLPSPHSVGLPATRNCVGVVA